MSNASEVRDNEHGERAVASIEANLGGVSRRSFRVHQRVGVVQASAARDLQHSAGTPGSQRDHHSAEEKRNVEGIALLGGSMSPESLNLSLGGPNSTYPQI